MTGAGLLLVASLALPLGMAFACLWPGFRARALAWLVVAPLPALLAALLARRIGGSRWWRRCSQPQVTRL